MNVILLLEGTYPYAQGGVSSWTQTLLRSLPEHAFHLVYIGARKMAGAQYKYVLPDNVQGVQEVYLHEPEKPAGRLRFWRQRQRDEVGQWFTTGAWPSRETLQTVRARRQTPSAEAILAEEWAWEASLQVYRSLPEPPALSDFVWSWRAMWLPLLRLLRAPLPRGDVLHAQSTGYAGWLGALMARLTGLPLIVTEHGIYTREREEEIVRADWVPWLLKGWWHDFFASLGRASYEVARFVTTLSGVNQQAQVRYGAPRSKLRLIPNGVDPQAFAPITAHQGQPFVIGAIIRVVPIKDIKTLLRAMAIVRAKWPESKLFLIGPQDEDPEYYQECLALIAFLGIADAVVWTGPVNIMEYLPQLNCMVLTSISEGQPLVMLEAMAAGLPLVVTDVGACRELIEGGVGDTLGRCGHVTKLMTPDETAQALLALAADPDRCAEMGCIGRARVQRYYHLSHVMHTYRTLYNEAVRG